MKSDCRIGVNDYGVGLESRSGAQFLVKPNLEQARRIKNKSGLLLSKRVGLRAESWVRPKKPSLRNLYHAKKAHGDLLCCAGIPKADEGSSNDLQSLGLAKEPFGGERATVKEAPDRELVLCRFGAWSKDNEGESGTNLLSCAGERNSSSSPLSGLGGSMWEVWIRESKGPIDSQKDIEECGLVQDPLCMILKDGRSIFLQDHTSLMPPVERVGVPLGEQRFGNSHCTAIREESSSLEVSAEGKIGNLSSPWVNKKFLFANHWGSQWKDLKMIFENSGRN